MLGQITAFESGAISVGALVDDLEGLLLSLEKVDESWRKSFYGAWGKLEDERAYAIDQGTTAFDDAATKRIMEAVGLLKVMVLERIENEPESCRPSE